MSYIQQVDNGGGGGGVSHGGVMSGAYEVHMDDSVDQKNSPNAGDVIILEQSNQQQQPSDATTNNSNTTIGDGQSTSTNVSDGRHQVSERTTRSKTHSIVIAQEKSPLGNSYKFPVLKQYFEFGPWVGRNRKAQCLACSHQSCSSQPDRLLKHLKRCNALSEADKSIVEELMNERTANKRKKPIHLRLRSSDNDPGSPYYNYEDNNNNNNNNNNTNSADEVTVNASSVVPIPPSTMKRIKRDHPDRKAHLDEALTRFIMVNRIPLKAIHSKEFVDFTRALDPDYRIPSRETITNILIPGLLNIL